MKYIRTKDGRISYLIREPDEELIDYQIITSKGTVTYYMEYQVIKIADTIEELCDEFVFIGQDGIPILLDTVQACLDRIEDLRLTNYQTLCGAIWTNKGLIYVAKMNNEGKLELI